MTNYFISDTHFGDENIIKYMNRPFANAEEMERRIVKNWNAKVKKEDIVWVVGDFCFEKSTKAPNSKGFNYYKNQLNGTIIFFNGSHDKNNKCKSILRNAIVEHGGHVIHLTHDPKYANEKYDLNICGHVHGKNGRIFKQGSTIVIDVSVENWDYRPIDINEINQELSKWKKEHNLK
jgi:calcineurin-like phosphoesterase family protein